MFIIPIVLIGILLVGCAVVWRLEYKDWNYGICRTNGLSWKCFDVDSQGGRGYNAGSECIWISYPVDRKAA